MEFKYCWLNIETGEFSNSWDQEVFDACGGMETFNNAKTDKFKLIKFTCYNDPDFEFTHHMKLK